MAGFEILYIFRDNVLKVLFNLDTSTVEMIFIFIFLLQTDFFVHLVLIPIFIGFSMFYNLNFLQVNLKVAS